MDTKRASREELLDIKRFYELTEDSQKHQAIVTSNRRRKDAIERRMLAKDLPTRTLVGETSEHVYIASLVEDRMTAFVGDIREKLLEVGYTEDQVMQISEIFRMQRKVLRLKVSRVALDKEDGEL